MSVPKSEKIQSAIWIAAFVWISLVPCSGHATGRRDVPACVSWESGDSDGFENALQYLQLRGQFVALEETAEKVGFETKLGNAIQCVADFTQRYLYEGFKDQKQAVIRPILAQLAKHEMSERVSQDWTPDNVGKLVRALGYVPDGFEFWKKLLDQQLQVREPIRPAYRSYFVEGFLLDGDTRTMEWAIGAMESPSMPGDVRREVVRRFQNFAYPYAWQRLAESGAVKAVLHPAAWAPNVNREIREIRDSGLDLLSMMVKGRVGADSDAIRARLQELLEGWSHSEFLIRIQEDRTLWTTWTEMMMTDDTRLGWAYHASLNGLTCDQRGIVIAGVGRLLLEDSDYTRTKAAFYLLGGWGGYGVKDWIRGRLIRKTPEEKSRERDEIRKRRESSELWAVLGAISSLLGGGQSTGSIVVPEYKPFPRLSSRQFEDLMAVYRAEFPNCH